MKEQIQVTDCQEKIDPDKNLCSRFNDFHIDLIGKFKEFEEELNNLDKLKADKKAELISWCNKNRTDIKLLFPKKNKIYQIVDVKKCHHYRFDNLEDGTYYFKVIDNRFIPLNDFNNFWGIIMPTVLGSVLDCNLKPMDYSDTRTNITNLIEIKSDKHPESLSNGFTKVYVMIDKNTGYYKIGRSNNPIHREKTLQSEKPSIELLHQFYARIKDEKELHNLFSTKRIRGEWFDLSGSDISKVFDYFNG
jgi:hypothetical protein